MPRWSSEYSSWTAASGVRPGEACCRAADLASCQPLYWHTPTYRARPEETARSSACRVSSVGVAGSYACTCHRSTWSVPRRRSEASRAFSRWPREASVRGEPGSAPALVAMTSSERGIRLSVRRDSRYSAPPSAYTSAVSTSVPPASTNAFNCSAASCSSVSRPQVRVPRPSRETRRPVRPSSRCSIAPSVNRAAPPHDGAGRGRCAPTWSESSGETVCCPERPARPMPSAGNGGYGGTGTGGRSAQQYVSMKSRTRPASSVNSNAAYEVRVAAP